MSQKRSNQLICDDDETLTTFHFWRLIRYKALLLKKMISIYNDDKKVTIKKFTCLITRWLTGTPQHPISLWPVRSIVRLEDIKYAASRRGFTMPIEDVMRVCDAVYTQLSKYWIDLKRRPKFPIICSLSSEQERMVSNRYMFGNNPSKSSLERILFWYGLVGKGMQISVPPEVIKKVVNVELFGSCLSTCALTYCSALAVEKDYYGAQGTYREFLEDHSNGFAQPTVILANPPFDTSIMDDFAVFLTEVLPSMKNTTFLVVLPCWDGNRQKKFGLWDSGEPMKSFNILHQSPFMRMTTFLPRDTYTFYDYFVDSRHHTTNSELISISSDDCSDFAEMIHTRFTTSWRLISQDDL